ncbi:MAG: tRNA-intron lyase [Candidatus Bathyarchaeota archaeon]|nr:MAG: tRNA-intron lyase [Candidatus Bathyarchaeota archaeon]
MDTELVENKLVVWNTEKGCELYKLGFFGKPVGVSKPKSFNFNSPLIIDLIEGLYLLEKQIIRVYTSKQSSARVVTRPIGTRKLKNHARKVYDRFDLNYVVYKNLRDHNYIVLPGIKFGCEYAVYERGPGIDHAPYLISVKGSEEEITSTDIVRAGRLATSVKKRFIIAIPDLNTKKVEYLIFNWFRA